MQTDNTMCHNYETPHLKKIAIEEAPSISLKIIANAAIR